MVFEIMEHRDIWITRDLGALLTNLLIRPQILRGELVVRAVIVRTQDDTAHCVKGDRASDVGMLRDEIDEVARLRFGSRIWTGTALIALGAPTCREIAIQVQALLG